MHAHTSRRPKKGQSLIIVAFAIIALVALVGLAVDLGLVYVERIRIRRAADAAALAAAAELPLEGAADVRALEYLQENNYPCGLSAQYAGGALTYVCDDPDTRVEIDGGASYTSGPAVDDAKRVISIDTVQYRDDAYAADTANRIKVAVRSMVPLYFMRIIGFDAIPVYAYAVGENINDLDVVLVFDKSGSMEFDTLCYGCWTDTSSQEYPEGSLHPLPWNGPANGPPYACSGTGSYVTVGSGSSARKYIIIEAEDYSRNSVPYDRDLYVQGMTYWALNRNGGHNNSQFSGSNNYLIDPDDGGAGALGRDSTGAYMSHLPFASHAGGAEGQGSSCTWSDLTNGGMCVRDDWISSVGGPFPDPRLDYDFQVPSNGTWYVWVRGTGGDGAQNIMWGRDRSPYGSVTGDGDTNFVNTGYDYNGADADYWRWVKLGSLGNLSTGHTYELNIWGGAAGFDLDRIVITTNTGTPNDAGSTVRSAVLNDTGHIDNDRTDQACNPCDARYGGFPGGTGGTGQPNCQLPGFPADHPQNWRYTDWLFDDEQPIRGAVEASKRFIRRLDPRYDQVGLVTYQSSATTDEKLQCVRRLGTDNCDMTDFEDTVIAKLDATHAGGGTNIAEAMLKGIAVLSNTSGQYGRPAAAHIMILMTDGEANVVDGVSSACYAQDYWPQNTGDSTRDRAKDCVIYYTRLARDNGIVVYTITLGASADIELMAQVADITGGVHRHAPRPEQLDPIFNELYERIFLRLVE